MRADRGLRAVATDDLKALLRELHRGRLSCPITPTALAVVGLLRLADELAVLRGLDAAGVRAALVVAIAERQPLR